MREGMPGVGSEERAESVDRQGDAALHRVDPDLLGADGAGTNDAGAPGRLVPFLVLRSGAYLSVVIINGVLLSAGALHGPTPPGLTVVPAGIAGLVILVFLLIALLPGDLERRAQAASRTTRRGR